MSKQKGQRVKEWSKWYICDMCYYVHE